MLGYSSEDSNQLSVDNSSVPEGSLKDDVGEVDWYGYLGELEPEIDSSEQIYQECLSVGDYLPHGPSLYLETSNNTLRMKDIGERRRVLVLGVIGSFTPYCWNRHLFRVLSKTRYYEERDVDFICCISTNDAYTHSAWGEHLGCNDIVLMLSDPTRNFTKSLGMDIVLPWLDNTVRSKRYIIFAENMEVTKFIVAPDGPNLDWKCEHLREEEKDTENDDESDSWF